MPYRQIQYHKITFDYIQIDKSWTLWIKIMINIGKNKGNDIIFNQIKQSIKEK